MIDTFYHKQEKQIAELLDSNNIDYTYHQGVLVYSRNGPAITVPSFFLPSYYSELIIDYVPADILDSVKNRTNLYKENNLDAIIITREYFQNDNWQQDLYKHISGYRLY